MRRGLFFFFAVYLLVLAAPCLAAKRAFTIEDLYRVRGIDDLHISPDGTTIVFTIRIDDLPKAKRVKHIWLMNADGGNARQFTFGEKGESSPMWSADGKWIVFVSGRDGDDNLFVISASGGEARKLTNISTGVADPVWSRDGKWIAFSSDVYPECGADDACNKKIEQRWAKGPLHAHTADALLYRHWTEWKDGKRAHVLLADVATGSVRDLTPGDFDSPPFQLGGMVRYDFSPDSTELAFDSNHDREQASSTNSDVWVVSLTGDQPPRNITASNRAFDGHPRYSPDGKYIAYQMQKQPGYESDLIRLAVYERATGTSRVLTESFRNWVDEFHWASDSKSLYFSAPVEGDDPIFRVTVESGSTQEVLVDRTIDSFDLSRDDRGMIYTRRSVGAPVEIFAADWAGGKFSAPRRLSHFNDELANEVDIRPAERMWVKGAEARRSKFLL